MRGEGTTGSERAREARIRLADARAHITSAIEAISGPEPDWVLCEAHMDMAGDVMPAVPREAAAHGEAGAR